MTLHVHDDESGRNVWIDGVPSDMSDSDVEAVVKELADDGNRAARLAMAMIPAGRWCRINCDGGSSRVYLDA